MNLIFRLSATFTCSGQVRVLSSEDRMNAGGPFSFTDDEDDEIDADYLEPADPPHCRDIFHFHCGIYF